MMHPCPIPDLCFSWDCSDKSHSIWFWNSLSANIGVSKTQITPVFVLKIWANICGKRFYLSPILLIRCQQEKHQVWYQLICLDVEGRGEEKQVLLWMHTTEVHMSFQEQGLCTCLALCTVCNLIAFSDRTSIDFSRARISPWWVMLSTSIFARSGPQSDLLPLLSPALLPINPVFTPSLPVAAHYTFPGSL